MPALAWLAPMWLWGLTAAAVPIAVHFLSRGPARRVRVGSVALIEPRASRRARRLRFTEPLLAAVRVLLVVAVAVALAGPVFVRAPNASTWVLVDPSLFADEDWRQAEPAIAERLETAAREGTVRLLAAGLPARDAMVDQVSPPIGGVWSLLRYASALTDTEARFEVFTRGTLGELHGVRPRIGPEVRWHVVPPAPVDSVVRRSRVGSALATWSMRASAAGSVVTRGASVLAAGARNPRQSPLIVLVASDENRSQDAGYVVTAVEAVVRAGWIDAEIVRIPAAGDSPLDAADLAIWLAEDPLPSTWVAWANAGGFLLRDAPGARYRECGGRLGLVPGYAGVALRRCSAAREVADSDALLATDTDGNPLLTASQGGRFLRFGGRFHPTWSDWVVDASFPVWIAGLLDAAGRASGRVTGEFSPDLRLADHADRRPARSLDEVTPLVPSVPGARDSIALWFWAVVGMLLVVERWLAARRLR